MDGGTLSRHAAVGAGAPPVQPGLVLALVLPLLALGIFIVIAVGVELGMFR